MTKATKEALVKIDQILHETGWDNLLSDQERGELVAPQLLQENRSAITPSKLAQIRHAYESLLREDHFEILTLILKERLSLETAAERLGMSAEKSSQLFQEALQRLGDFVETCDQDSSESEKEKSFQKSVG